MESERWKVESEKWKVKRTKWERIGGVRMRDPSLFPFPFSPCASHFRLSTFHVSLGGKKKEPGDRIGRNGPGLLCRVKGCQSRGSPASRERPGAPRARRVARCRFSPPITLRLIGPALLPNLRPTPPPRPWSRSDSPPRGCLGARLMIQGACGALKNPRPSPWPVAAASGESILFPGRPLRQPESPSRPRMIMQAACHNSSEVT